MASLSNCFLLQILIFQKSVSHEHYDYETPLYASFLMQQHADKTENNHKYNHPDKRFLEVPQFCPSVHK